MPAIDDLRDLLDRQRRALENSDPGVRDGSDPEELHRFRVAMRRTRALIRASRPIVRDQLASLDRELRWLGGATGEVRDLDVLIDHVRELLPSLDPDGNEANRIVAALVAERERSRDELVGMLETDRYRALMRRFSEAVPALHAANGNASLARLARKELGRLLAAYGQLDPDAGDDEVHGLRIRAKHARYATELAATTAGREYEELA